MEKDQIEYYINVSMEEYKTLREEVKQSTVNQFQSLSLGSAVVGVLLSAGFVSWDKTPLMTITIFSLFVPLLSFLFSFLWLGEMARMLRAGNFIVMIERKIGTIVQVPPDLLAKHTQYDQGLIVTQPLSWESYLRTSRDLGLIQGHMAWVYKVRLWIFPAVSIVSWNLGALYLTCKLVKHEIHFPYYVVVSYIIVLFIWIWLLIKSIRVFNDITKRENNTKQTSMGRTERR